MGDEKINISADGVKEIVIRNGEAAPIKLPKRIDITGSIAGPVAFATVREPDPQQAVVTYSYEHMRLEYMANPEDKDASVITGQVEMNPDLERFKINKEHFYSTKELAKFLKMNRMFFPDKEENAAVVTALNSFTAKVETDMDRHQDTRGNARAMVDKKATSNVPERFKLQMPIIKGGQPVSFFVEIGLDVSDAGARVWLESAELVELTFAAVHGLIDQQVAFFHEKGVPCIEI